MERFVYLLNYKFSGIKNVEKILNFSFYKETINNDYNPEPYKVKGIYGTNGVGKTAVVRSFDILIDIMFNRQYLTDSVNIEMLKNIINKKTNKAFMEVEFAVGDESLDYTCKYNIEIARVDNEINILSENLLIRNGSYSKNNYEPVYSVKNGVIDDSIDIDSTLVESSKNLLLKQTFSSIIFKNETLRSLRGKNENMFFALLGLIAFHFNVNIHFDTEDDHVSSINRKKINDMIAEVVQGGNVRDLSTKEIFSNFVSGEQIPKADKFLSAYEDRLKRATKFIKLFKPELKEISYERKENKDYYEITAIKFTYNDYAIDFDYESCGIKRLFNIFNKLDWACSGGISFVDEIDANINDVYLQKMIKYFIEYGKGQLCFTSHNLSPMEELNVSKKSIDFITQINTVEPWIKSGHRNPIKEYRGGLIKNIPYNIDPIDFIGVLGTYE